jgi:hypothetical protein
MALIVFRGDGEEAAEEADGGVVLGIDLGVLVGPS